MEKIKIEEIEAAIERKKIRNIYISIDSHTGEIGISAPLKAPLGLIEKFFKSKLAWMRRHREKISQKPPKPQNRYVFGEKVEVYGKKYDLKVYGTDKTPKVFLNFDSMDLYINPAAEAPARQKAVDDFYKAKLEEMIPSVLMKWEKKLGISAEPNSLMFCLKNIQNKLFGAADGIGSEKIILKSPAQFAFRKMKGRWGSCNISDKKITLNTNLAKKSPRCIEYVTVHELLHLKERNHNKRFKDYMKTAFPDWKKLEDELNGN